VKRIIVVVLLAAATLAAGCGDNGGEAAKAGATKIKPVTLRIGTDDEPGKPAADQIEEFARRVQDLSGGAIAVEPVWHAAGEGPDWDQRVARMINGDELDMGLIPSRSWDTEGVTTLRALNTPFLIDSDALLQRVIATDDLAADLMTGLDEAGVRGIALFPEGLRHPFGMKTPMRGPDDYRGGAIRTPTSKTTTALFTALGAAANDDEPDPSEHTALESSYVLEPNGVSTGNVTFYPKVNVLVIAGKTDAQLDDRQRAILAKAAAQTRSWAIDAGPTDAEAAQAFCAQGRRVVLAGAAELAALERAAQPVTDELEQDAPTAEAIAAIRTLKDSVTAEPPAACDGASGGNAHSAKLDGVYRFRITDAQLREFGITAPDDIAENHGSYTVTMRGGEYCWVQKGPNPVNNPDECSTYVVDGDELTWNFPVGQPDVYRFTKRANGDLKLTAVSGEDIAYAKGWAVNVWKRDK
jgi:TRAP-type C4-dicarboxylate transport system substrate-binding protein